MYGGAVKYRKKFYYCSAAYVIVTVILVDERREEFGVATDTETVFNGNQTQVQTHSNTTVHEYI